MNDTDVIPLEDRDEVPEQIRPLLARVYDALIRWWWEDNGIDISDIGSAETSAKIEALLAKEKGSDSS